MAKAIMPVRQKREWDKKLLAAQEEVEAAQEKLAAVMAAASKAGMTPYAIAKPIGSTSTTVKKTLGIL